MHLRTRQHGVGMLEVLAALFVLSVGLLGIAGMQAQGIRAGNSATLRSTAVLKSVEIVERMRTNRNGIRDALGVSSYNASFATTGVDGQCEDSEADGNAQSCNVQQMASHDIFRWKQSLSAAFPNMNPQGSIGVVLGPTWNTPHNVVIQVQWTERGVQQNYITQVQFVCNQPTVC